MALSGAPAGQVHPGDTVRGSDGMEIGTVKEVVPGDDEAEAHMVVPRGMIFSNHTYIPLDTVVRRAGDQVVVNVPKLVIAKCHGTSRRRGLIGRRSTGGGRRRWRSSTAHDPPPRMTGRAWPVPISTKDSCKSVHVEPGEARR